MEKGLANLDRHIRNIRKFGQTVLVCFNRFASDTEEEISLVRNHCMDINVPFALNEAYAKGGEGAVELAKLVVSTIEETPSKPLETVYSEDDTFEDKIRAIAQKIYGANAVNFSEEAKTKLANADALGYGKFPVCIAKTQYSFSQDPKRYGVPEDFSIDIRDIVINSGSEMIVAIAGNIIRMPGLPKAPQALNIDVRDGNIDGLS